MTTLVERAQIMGMLDSRLWTILIVAVLMFSLSKGVGENCDEFGHFHNYKISSPLSVHDEDASSCHSAQNLTLATILEIPEFDLVLISPAQSPEPIYELDNLNSEPDISPLKRPPRPA